VRGHRRANRGRGCETIRDLILRSAP
jgi:hypothetical protein